MKLETLSYEREGPKSPTKSNQRKKNEGRNAKTYLRQKNYSEQRAKAGTIRKQKKGRAKIESENKEL